MVIRLFIPLGEAEMSVDKVKKVGWVGGRAYIWRMQPQVLSWVRG